MGGRTICSRPIKVQVFPPTSLSSVVHQLPLQPMTTWASSPRKTEEGLTQSDARDVLRMPRPEFNWFIRILIRLRLLLRASRFILVSTIQPFRTSCRHSSRGNTIHQARVPSGRRQMPFFISASRLGREAPARDGSG